MFSVITGKRNIRNNNNNVFNLLPPSFLARQHEDSQEFLMCSSFQHLLIPLCLQVTVQALLTFLTNLHYSVLDPHYSPFLELAG